MKTANSPNIPGTAAAAPRYSGYANCPPFMCSLPNFHHLTPDQERCGRINKAEDNNIRLVDMGDVGNVQWLLRMLFP
jgi:hypothetical protein